MSGTLRLPSVVPDLTDLEAELFHLCLPARPLPPCTRELSLVPLAPAGQYLMIEKVDPEHAMLQQNVKELLHT